MNKEYNKHYIATIGRTHHLKNAILIYTILVLIWDGVFCISDFKSQKNKENNKIAKIYI